MTLRRDFEDEARKRGWNLDRVLWGVEGWEESAYKDALTLARWESWELAAKIYGGK